VNTNTVLIAIVVATRTPIVLCLEYSTAPTDGLFQDFLFAAFRLVWNPANLTYPAHEPLGTDA